MPSLHVRRYLRPSWPQVEGQRPSHFVIWPRSTLPRPQQDLDRQPRNTEDSHVSAGTHWDHRFPSSPANVSQK